MLASLYLRMALIGRFHPVLVHFPIALIVAAFGCELVSMATRSREWHVAAVANLRIGAAIFRSMLDRNGDGSSVDDLLGMAKGIFGGPKA